MPNRWMLVALSLLAIAPVQARAGVDDMTPSEQASVQQALNRGALIYAYDQAAWHGTDDLRAKDPSALARAGGWIVDGPADAPEFVFIDKDIADPHIVYVADFKNDKLTSSHVLGVGDDASLSPERKRLVGALRSAQAAMATANISRCADRPFNTVILPAASPTDPTLVYFLTPQTEIDVIPFGGHYLVPVKPDGSTGPIRAFTKSCLNVKIGDKTDSKSVGLFVSHLLDPTPTEIHVFSSLAAHLPVYVSTIQNKKTWVIEGDRIRLVDQSKKK